MNTPGAFQSPLAYNPNPYNWDDAYHATATEPLEPIQEVEKMQLGNSSSDSIDDWYHPFTFVENLTPLEPSAPPMSEEINFSYFLPSDSQPNPLIKKLASYEEKEMQKQVSDERPEGCTQHDVNRVNQQREVAVENSPEDFAGIQFAVGDTVKVQYEGNELDGKKAYVANIYKPNMPKEEGGTIKYLYKFGATKYWFGASKLTLVRKPKDCKEFQVGDTIVHEGKDGPLVGVVMKWGRKSPSPHRYRVKLYVGRTDYKNMRVKAENMRLIRRPRKTKVSVSEE